MDCNSYDYENETTKRRKIYHYHVATLTPKELDRFFANANIDNNQPICPPGILKQFVFKDDNNNLQDISPELSANTSTDYNQSICPRITLRKFSDNNNLQAIDRKLLAKIVGDDRFEARTQTIRYDGIIVSDSKLESISDPL